MLLGGCVCEGLRPMMRSMKYSTVSADGQSGRAQYAASLSPTALWRPCPTSQRVDQRERLERDVGMAHVFPCGERVRDDA